MIGLIDTLLRADASRPLFVRGHAVVTAGDVRRLAQSVLPRVRACDGEIFLHTTSLAHFTAGLLAAATCGKTIALPAHTRHDYLAEIGASTDAVIDDSAFAVSSAESALEPQTLNPLLILFTSGSTETPKRIEKHLSQLETEARALDGLWGAEASHVIATVSHQHIYGMLFRLAWPVLSGRTSDDVAATYWEDLAGRFDGSTLISSPAHLTRLPPHAELFTPPPRLVYSSGQVLPTPAAQDSARVFGTAPVEVFGSTETGGIAWRRQTTPDEAWTPFPCLSVTADDERALIVRSPFLPSDAPFKTGDVIDQHSDGRFRLLPRGDRVAKIDGKRVSLTRVEAVLGRLPEVDAVAALTLPERRDALGAVVTLTAEGAALLQARGAFRLSRHLRTVTADVLEPSERPKHWRFVEAIPTDSQGKRVLATLRALFDAKADPLATLDLDIRAHTETEAQIAFSLPPELIFFRGHFLGQPILPGVAQAHIAVLLAQKFWPGWRSDANLTRLKFRRVLAPGDAVVLHLKRNVDSARVWFRYEFGDIDASQGELSGLKP